MSFAPLGGAGSGGGVGPAVPSSSSASPPLRPTSALASPTDAVPGREPLLFTPGPLTCSSTVKQAMLVDLGSRDVLFTSAVRSVRDRLLAMAHQSQESGYECVIVQGSGTFAIESVVGSVVPPSGGKFLVLSNGAYGLRMAKICETLGIDVVVKDYGERGIPTAEDAARIVADDPDVTHVGVIHHETTTGALNPVVEIGRAIKSVRPDLCYVIDSMSAFGCFDIDLADARADYLVSSSNKCIEGVPGFAYALARREHLESTSGWARSLSLDLHAQWRGLEDNGQFRFTPPTHAVLAFRRALDEHDAEGGVAGRHARYRRNFEVLNEGMRTMGFVPYLPAEVQAPIITTYLWPDDEDFDFGRMYDDLASRGYVIYPGKLTDANCFRIGSIGRLFERDMRALLAGIKESLEGMGVNLPVRQIEA